MDICYAYDAGKLGRPVLFVVIDEHLMAEWWLAAPSFEMAIEHAKKFAQEAFNGTVTVCRHDSYLLSFILQREINEEEEPRLLNCRYTKFGFERGR